MDTLDKILDAYEEDIRKQSVFNNDNKYDFSTDPKLIHGQLIEKNIFEILSDDKITFEVKSESKCVWGKTEALYVEYAQFKNGEWVDSGISATTADYWVVALKNYFNDQPVCGHIILNTQHLKDRIHTLIQKGIATHNSKPKSDDGSATKAWIVPIMSLFVYDGEYDEFKLDRIKNLPRNQKKI